MFAADAELDVRPRCPAPVNRHLDQLADADAVQNDERVAVNDGFVLIGGQERARIVARNAKRGLRQIIGAEREKLRRLGNDALP